MRESFYLLVYLYLKNPIQSHHIAIIRYLCNKFDQFHQPQISSLQYQYELNYGIRRNLVFFNHKVMHDVQRTFKISSIVNDQFENAEG